MTRSSAFAIFCTVVCISSGSANAAPQCPSPITGSKIPSKEWSDTATKPTYYAPDSAVINVGNGQVVDAGASYATVKSKMGGAFSGAKFDVVGGPGSGGGLTSTYFSCSYDGPRFQSGGKTLEATVTVACKASCSGL